MILIGGIRETGNGKTFHHNIIINIRIRREWPDEHILEKKINCAVRDPGFPPDPVPTGNGVPGLMPPRRKPFPGWKLWWHFPGRDVPAPATHSILYNIQGTTT
ncbi:MAG: hypothetical protein LUQ01_01690 [Methanolinea sp.]|nr:hypothetical protein [Methanolinea sp.]